MLKDVEIRKVYIFSLNQLHDRTQYWIFGGLKTFVLRGLDIYIILTQGETFLGGSKKFYEGSVP